MAKGKMIKLCGLWISKTDQGATYMNGGLTYSSNLLIFKNKYKEEGDKNPDYIAYVAEKQKKEAESTTSNGDSDVPF